MVLNQTSKTGKVFLFLVIALIFAIFAIYLIRQDHTTPQAFYKQPPFVSSPSSLTSPFSNENEMRAVPGLAQSKASSPPPAETQKMAPHQLEALLADVTLGIKIRHSLEAGSPTEALKRARDISFCKQIDQYIQLISRQKDSGSSEMREKLSLALRFVQAEQRACQSLDAAAYDLYRPLLLKALVDETVAPEAALLLANTMSSPPELDLATKSRIAVGLKVGAAQGNLSAILSLTGSSGEQLPLSMQERYTYSLAARLAIQARGQQQHSPQAVNDQVMLADLDQQSTPPSALSESDLATAKTLAQVLANRHLEIVRQAELIKE